MRRSVECFLSGNARQRSQIIGNTSAPDQLWRLVQLIAHTGTRIKLKTDVSLFRHSLGIAVIEGGRHDFRDTTSALMILRYGAERVGIDTAPLFDECEAIANPRGRDILRNVRSRTAKPLADWVVSADPVIWLWDFTDKMAKLRVSSSGELFLNDERVSFDTLKGGLDQIRKASGVVFCEYEEPQFAKCPMTRAVCDEIKKKTTDKSGSFQQIMERRYKDAQLLDEQKDRR